jgi:putative FmdB family regulatory protein
LPVYEYECTGCSSHFELIRGFNDDGDVSCPECGCDAQRIFSPVPVIFKGSGFYVTDQRSNTNQPQSTTGETGSSESKPEPAGEKAGASGTDTKE